jgi:fructokinase
MDENDMRVLSIGEVLWDHCGALPTIGGAPLNFSAHLAFLKNTVALLSAVGQDVWGKKAIEKVAALGIDCRFLQTSPSAPTGSTSVTLVDGGEPLSIINRPAAYECTRCSPSTVRQIRAFDPDWLYFGTLFHVSPHLLDQTLALRRHIGGVKVIYDVNLRRDNWNLQLVERLSSCANIVKMNEWEARTIADAIDLGDQQNWLHQFGGIWLDRFHLDCVCITLGSEGCTILTGDGMHTIRGASITPVDTLGAGDAFCAGLLHGWHNGWAIEETGKLANFLGRVVAGKRGAIPTWTPDDYRLLQQECGIMLPSHVLA